MRINPNILSVATVEPEFSKTTPEILEDIDKHLRDHPVRFRQKVNRIFKYAQVDRRYSIMPAEEVTAPLSFEQKNNRYHENAIRISEKALRAALERADVRPEELDYIITTSCTGFMIPSVDAYLINNLGLKQDIIRLPVTEMGCAAGISALIYARNFLLNDPEKHAAIISFESPMSTFQWNDFSMTNMVSAAIFGDGCACAILGPSKKGITPEIQDHQMYHFYDEVDMMGFELKNTGFKMVLDPSVPEKIETHFEQILMPFIQRNDLEMGDIDHLVFHPGGKKIVKVVEELFGKMGKNIEHTKGVLRDYGNMSSATVLYVLKRFMDGKVESGDYGLMLSFGPGFSAQSLLLQWK